MKYLSFLIKPASSICNLRCRYCFYEDESEKRAIKSMGIMTEQTAEKIILKAFEEIEPGGSISFMFQGGEPTLAGLDFYKRFLSLEKIYGRPDVHVSHAIQTNAMTITREWAEFFQKYNFLVGISLDGIQLIHDQNRVDVSGKGTWHHVISSLKLLEEYQLDINILCVVTAQTVDHTEAVWKTLSGLENHPLQFIPCLDPIESPRGNCQYSLTPKLYKDFLVRLFDCWYSDWKEGTYTSVRLFDDYLRILMGSSPSCCAASGTCGHYLVVEGDGSLYPCDFYVLDQWYMGNIHNCTIQEALNSTPSKKFVADGRKRPESCKKCKYLQICRGGCKRDWTDAHSNYYCSAYREFFDYALLKLQSIARNCI